MKTRVEILGAARQVGDAVAQSAEMQELLRCEAALGRLQGKPLDPASPDPRVQEYLAARAQAERLIGHVWSAFFFPLTGHIAPERTGPGDCGGCPGRR